MGHTLEQHYSVTLNLCYKNRWVILLLFQFFMGVFAIVFFDKCFDNIYNTVFNVTKAYLNMKKKNVIAREGALGGASGRALMMTASQPRHQLGRHE